MQPWFEMLDAVYLQVIDQLHKDLHAGILAAVSIV